MKTINIKKHSTAIQINKIVKKLSQFSLNTRQISFIKIELYLLRQFSHYQHPPGTY